ncbi:MAG TPA: bifunctional demethylmenaquinone methyltransferase/2-methoxy-6-polyprenyl-1,4-benzoquinol methylase UbiE [Vicinamibacterales bacterium]|nr:bifunctional demethylmenaquinone methyltransferase/2-methoxy-6-polyprenyl-1,4-benzoquinol methylase UbiE [Vicinamibacterales bacterium]
MTDVSKAPARIAGMFDAIAGRYDFLNHVLSAGIDRRWRKRAIRGLELTGRECVLDLCTGTADLAIDAMQAHPSAARVVGIDFAGAMLAIGRDKVAAAGLSPAIALVRGDAMRIPLADESVDAVTIAFGIRNVADVPAACREIHRVLKPGGRVAILEFAVPTLVGFKQIYMWYVRNVLPRVGRAISRHDAAYKYLQASIEAFVTPAEFVTILRQSGFVEIRPVQLMLGSVFLYEARRRSG